MTSRNVFENNDPVPDKEDVKAVGNGPHIMLPPLSEGHHYALTDLPNGRKAVVVVEDEKTYKRRPMTIEKKDDELTPEERDMFGRHKL